MAGDLVVLSGGLDSTVCMALARQESGSSPLALTFDYGQRHRTELDRSAGVAGHFRSEHLVVVLDTSAWGGSALTDPSIDVPSAGSQAEGAGGDDGGTGGGIPVTYVPARNSIFLAVALGVAEARQLDAVWIGVNAIDYSGYPDCRPEFIEAFRGVAATGQKRGVEGDPMAIRTPLIESTKADIVRLGLRLEAPLAMTWSCYQGGDVPCGTCDACVLRARGFAEAGVDDPRWGDLDGSADRHLGHRGLLRHPGGGGAGRGATGLRPADRLQHPLCLLRSTRSTRPPARPVPDRAAPRADATGRWRTAHSPSPR